MDECYVTPSGLELGVCKTRMGHLSESSVLAKAGGSVVHVTVNSGAAAETPTEDFLPLTVDYRARYSAFGKISDERKRKEKHGGDEEILVGRFIDRAIRPLFPKGYVDEVQMLVTNHAADGVHDPTVLAVNGASLALLRSKQPWFGPIGCVRVGIVDNELKVNPTVKEMESSPLDLLYAGTATRAVMVEAGGQQIPEERMKSALSLAHSAIQEIVAAQRQAIAADTSLLSKKRKPLPINAALLDALKAKHWHCAVQLYRSNVEQKEGRSELEGKFRAEMLAELESERQQPLGGRWAGESALSLGMAVDSLMHSAFRAAILDPSPSPSPVRTEEIVRSDGRAVTQLRPIQSHLDVLPSVHGSAYFGRGDTHVVCATTLGSFDDARPSMPLNGLGVEKRDFFVLHYDFPPYCTGELGNANQTSRRAIGHGNLAEKAVAPVLPKFEEFPYTIKVHSECVSSNGSSSMASACGASLALLNAGVPLRAPVAGVSVGLITEDAFAEKFHSAPPAVGETERETHTQTESGRYVLLKDILGSEDHHGDMDFKVAGSAAGITAIQLDVKLAGGVPLPLLFQGIDLAREGRLEILEHMLSPHAAALSTATLKPHAPRAELIKFDPERKGSLIGPNGEMMKFIEDLYDVTLKVVNKESWQHITQNYVPHGSAGPSPSSLISAQMFDDEIGVAYVYGDKARYVQEARSLVQDIAVTVKEGDVLMGEIVDVRDFGAIIQINRGQQALLRLSDLSYDRELLKKPVEELLIKNHRIQVQITSVDTATGVVKVSRKALLDIESSVPDNFRLTPPTVSVVDNQDATEEDALRELSTKFPTTPPRPWNREFFKHNVASETDIKTQMDALHGIVPAEKKNVEHKKEHHHSIALKDRNNRERREDRKDRYSQDSKNAPRRDGREGREGRDGNTERRFNNRREDFRNNHEEGNNNNNNREHRRPKRFPREGGVQENTEESVTAPIEDLFAPVAQGESAVNSEVAAVSEQQSSPVAGDSSTSSQEVEANGAGAYADKKPRGPRPPRRSFDRAAQDASTDSKRAPRSKSPRPKSNEQRGEASASLPAIVGLDQATPSSAAVSEGVDAEKQGVSQSQSRSSKPRQRKDDSSSAAVDADKRPRALSKRTSRPPGKDSRRSSSPSAEQRESSTPSTHADAAVTNDAPKDPMDAHLARMRNYSAAEKKDKNADTDRQKPAT